MSTSASKDRRERQWEAEEPWDADRIEGFRVVSPDTDEVNWPRDVIRAHMAARKEAAPELPPNVRRGRVDLEAAPATSRMRHEVAKGPHGETFPISQGTVRLEDTGAVGLLARAARDVAPDGGPQPAPSEILHPDRRPVFERVDETPGPVFHGLDLLITPTGPPMADRLTRKQRQEGAREMIAEMSDKAIERLRAKDYAKPFDVAAAEIAEFAEAAEEAVRVGAEQLDNTLARTGVHQGRSPAITGPYRGGNPSRFRINGPAVFVAVFIGVAIAVLWAFAWLATNWTY